MYDEFPLDVGQLFGIPPLSLGAIDLFGDGLLHLVCLPGHARGQIGLLIKLASRYLMLLADACWTVDNVTMCGSQSVVYVYL